MVTKSEVRIENLRYNYKSCFDIMCTIKYQLSQNCRLPNV